MTPVRIRLREKVRKAYVDSAVPENNFTPMKLREVGEMFNIHKTTAFEWTKDLRNEIDLKKSSVTALPSDTKAVDVTIKEEIQLAIKTKMIADKSAILLYRYVEDLAQRKTTLTHEEAAVVSHILQVTMDAYEKFFDDNTNLSGIKNDAK